jgi:glyoxylate/hydroxypyruvate reductase A
VVTATPEPKALAAIPGLEVVFSINAGVDALLREDVLPATLPLVRLVDPAMTAAMTEYVLGAVLACHRHLPLYSAQQRQSIWRQLPEKLAQTRPVGILGLGELGQSAAARLTANGFPTQGWSRSRHDIAGVMCRSGRDGLDSVLRSSEILVNVLPLTPDTDGLLDRLALAKLPRGAWLINVGRGRHIVETDLLAALDEGGLAGAVLDVFEVEPLPPGHPFWSHPRILLTPHVSAPTSVETAARVIAGNLLGYEAGEPLRNVVDRTAGY